MDRQKPNSRQVGFNFDHGGLVEQLGSQLWGLEFFFCKTCLGNVISSTLRHLDKSSQGFPAHPVWCWNNLSSWGRWHIPWLEEKLTHLTSFILAYRPGKQRPVDYSAYVRRTRLNGSSINMEVMEWYQYEYISWVWSYRWSKIST